MYREQSLSTLPGVLKVEGTDKAAGIFTSTQAVPPAAITPVRRPACSQQPADRLPRPHTSASTSRTVAAPVPIRASEMVAPNIWDLANMGRGESGNGNSRGRGGAMTKTSSSVQASGVAEQIGGAASVHVGGIGNSGATLAELLDGESFGGTATMMSAGSTLFSGETEQQLPGWGNTAPGWPAGGGNPRDIGFSDDRAERIGNMSRTWVDSADGNAAHGNDADIYRQGQLQGSAPSVVTTTSSSSSSSCARQYKGAAASKRLKIDSSMSLAGAARPNAQHHLQGYASLFGGDASAASGNTFGGSPAYCASSKLGEPGIGGVGFGDLAGDRFGSSGVDDGSAWVDAVFDSESASSSSPFLLNDK